MASIISLLVRFYKRNILRDKISVLVKGAINYLLQNKQDPIFYKYFFPGGITKDGNQKSGLGRLSWCYNDLGISIVLLQAGNAFNNEIWKGEAIQSLLHTSKITDWKEAGVMDAGLCHGTSGIAHLYNRAYTYTGIEIFKSSSIYWFEQSLKIATFENGLAGYKTYRTEKYGGMENNYSFLEGIAGIGLALISSVSQVDPTWDNALLIS
jgi:lantibiotic modifying enzyme